MVNKGLLLDFDGVCLKHPKSDSLVVKRIEQYANKYLNVSPKIIKKLNREIYTTTGHTAIGLKKLGFPVSMKDFNSYVYEELDYETIFKDIQETNRTDIKTLIDLKNYCYENNIPLSIFSNAPTLWCSNILRLMSPDLDHIHNVNEYIEDIPCTYFLKPDIDIFKIIEKKIKADKLYFVDDKFGNFMNIYNNPRWFKLLFGDTNDRIDDSIHIISDLSKVKDFM